MIQLQAHATATCHICGAHALTVLPMGERFRVDAFVALAIAKLKEGGWQVRPATKDRPASLECPAHREEEET